jgi:N-dimethylarginine dimethylaminohydrolase
MNARGTAVAVITGVTLSWLAATGLRATSGGQWSTPSGRIVTAAGGSLDELAIQFHRGTGGDAFLAVYAQMFAAMTPDTTVWVVVTDGEDEALFEAARRTWPPGPEVRYVRVGKPITNWARDRMAVLADDEGGAILVAPPAAHRGATARANDSEVPWALRRALGERGRVVKAPFAFEGGDLIADDAHVYAATPLFARNPTSSVGALTKQIGALTGRTLVSLGDARHPAPDHHVGMFVTPVGDGVVAYADPALGSAILFGQEPPQTSDSSRFVSAGGARYAIDESYDTRARFARVESDLRAAGVTVVALPVIPTTTPYVWIGYDNVLMDRREDGLHVLMPVYGIEALDDHAADLYRGLGAEVHPIDVREIFHLGGTVRCLAAVLVRGP